MAVVFLIHILPIIGRTKAPLRGWFNFVKSLKGLDRASFTISVQLVRFVWRKSILRNFSSGKIDGFEDILYPLQDQVGILCQRFNGEEQNPLLK